MHFIFEFHAFDRGSCSRQQTKCEQCDSKPKSRSSIHWFYMEARVQRTLPFSKIVRLIIEKMARHRKIFFAREGVLSTRVAFSKEVSASVDNDLHSLLRYLLFPQSKLHLSYGRLVSFLI